MGIFEREKKREALVTCQLKQDRRRAKKSRKSNTKFANKAES